MSGTNPDGQDGSTCQGIGSQFCCAVQRIKNWFKWHNLILLLTFIGVFVVLVIPLVADDVRVLRSLTSAAVPAMAAIAFHLFSVQKSAFSAALELDDRGLKKTE